MRELSARGRLAGLTGALLLAAGIVLAVLPGAAAAAPANGISLTEAMSRLTASHNTAQQVVCSNNVYITSRANGRIVSAELGYSGNNYAMLRARATAVGPWERYTICTDTRSGLSSIASQANRRIVSAELGYSGGDYAMLRARATAVGPWELYRIVSAGSGLAIISAANGRYVSAELGYSGSRYAMLRARATAAGPWEQFQ
ncbi:fascin domain-containing protein [Gandjariella thermophila]|uniref:Ricin B lectin domain-containing protein n=1 Tax=Gandjariella thermophila TaxID=1931992 RepID=A0A4D4JDY0_9PSEU|nr:hypothetical protein [Gandjariella thermophila]GDY32848.1 hypothetical protein GTS_44810 [Gandjariella thermophila]